MDTVLSSKTKPVTIGSDKPFCIIGERINPTSRKRFSEELREGNLDTVVVDTKSQVEAGADMLDVNAGIPLVDEAELLAKMLTLTQEATALPICIDSSVIEALEAGLGVYEGKALVNSVTGEDERLEQILPLVARHGAAVIGLANDDEIPMEPERRPEGARKIVSAPGGHGTCKKCKVRVLDGAVPVSSVDPRAFTPEELRGGWRLACRAPATEDLEIDVPPLQTRPKAAMVGVGRHVILRPSVQKRHVVMDEPSLEDQASDLERIARAV